jgi:hypothetical protein
MELLLIKTDQLGDMKSLSASALTLKASEKDSPPLTEEDAIQNQPVRSFVIVKECGGYY